jgi:murein DD-endopeptidase MepM/ murein hydrolase activator NlpD
VRPTQLRRAPVVAAVLLLAACTSGPDSSGGSRDAVRSPAATPTATAAASATRPPGPANVFPVKAPAAQIRYGRAHHDYPATDIFAPCGSVVVAPATGRIAEVSTRDAWSSSSDDGGDRGGLSFSLAGADGVRYYGSHLATLTPAARAGAAVTAGQTLGTVGRTGSARGTPCHLHFGLSPVCGPGDWWTRRGVVAPFAYLRAWQRGTQRSPVAAVRAWKAEHGCPRSPAGAPEA